MVVESIPCTPVIKGEVEGRVLFSRKPISFIGGVDPISGLIKDPLSDQYGKSIASKIFVFPFGKGSSGAGLVLLELARVGKAPKALVTLRTDTVLLTGPLISREFYKINIPMFNVDELGMGELCKASHVEIDGTHERIKIITKNNSAD